MTPISHYDNPLRIKGKVKNIISRYEKDSPASAQTYFILERENKEEIKIIMYGNEKLEAGDTIEIDISYEYSPSYMICDNSYYRKITKDANYKTESMEGIE